MQKIKQATSCTYFYDYIPDYVYLLLLFTLSFMYHKFHSFSCFLLLC